MGHNFGHRCQTVTTLAGYKAIVPQTHTCANTNTYSTLFRHIFSACKQLTAVMEMFVALSLCAGARLLWEMFM